MRSYIFTKRERRVIKNFLNGAITIKDPSLAVILSRIKGFKDLAGDVDLYMRLREAVTAVST